MQSLVRTAQEASEGTGRKVDPVEGELRRQMGEAGERSTCALRQVKEVEAKLESVETSLAAHLLPVERWKEQVDGLEKRVEGIEGEVKKIAQVRLPLPSPRVYRTLLTFFLLSQPQLFATPPSFPPAPPEKVLETPSSAPLPARTAPPTALSNHEYQAPPPPATSSSSDRATSPPRRRSRPISTPLPHTSSSRVLLPPSSLPTPSTSSKQQTSPALAVFPPPSKPSSSLPTRIVSTVPSKRRLLEQVTLEERVEEAVEPERGEAEGAEAGAEAATAEEESSALSSLTPSPPRPAAPPAQSGSARSRRRRIEQDATPRSTQEGGVTAAVGSGRVGGGVAGGGESVEQEEPSTQE